MKFTSLLSCLVCSSLISGLALGQTANVDPGNPALAAPAATATAADDSNRLMVQGTQDPKRLKELFDFFANAEAISGDRNSSKEKFDAIKLQEARVALAALNSLGALGLNIYLDKRHPNFKRDLSGAATLGDGRLPVRVLLLDTPTRVPKRTLVDSGAMTLLIATEPAKLQQDNREVITQGGMSTNNPARAQDEQVYLALIAEKLKEILAAKGIKLASRSSENSTAELGLKLVVADWAGKQRSEGVQEIGRDFPLVVAFDAQLRPAPRIESVLWSSSYRSGANNRELAEFAELVQTLQGRLNDPRFEKLAAISPADLAASRSQRLDAARGESDRVRQEMIDRIGRIRIAVAEKTELAGALRIYRKGKAFAGKPEDAFCTVKANEAMALLGLVRSPEFLTWSKFPKGTRFSKVYDSADEMYAAVTDSRCNIVVDYADNLNKYMTAIGRDGQFAYNVGPNMNREEAREPFAISLGFDNYLDYEFAQKTGNASAAQVRSLKEFGAGTLERFKVAAARMNSGKYSAETSPSAPVLLDFLDDEAKGKKVGKSAIDYRRAEDKRMAEEARLREEQSAKERAERAKSFPYIAILTCGMGKSHINVLACFAAQGSSSVDTELRLTNGDSTKMYKAYSLSEAGQERRDGFYIDLRKNFSIKAQNSHGTLILGLKVIDRLSGKVLFEKQAARFDVIAASN
jgi:hypothetical protein